MAGPERFLDMLGPAGGMGFGPDWLQNYINQSRGFINRRAPEIPKNAKSALDNILRTSGGNSTVNNVINQAKNRLGIGPLDLDLNIKGPNILDKTKFRLGGFNETINSAKDFLNRPINIGGEMQRHNLRQNVKGATDFLRGKVGSLKNLGVLKSGINFTPNSILKPTLGLGSRALVAEGIKRTTGIEGVYLSPREIMWGVRTATTNPIVGGGLAVGAVIDSFNPVGPKDEWGNYRNFLNESTAAAKKTLSELPESDLTIDQLQEKIKLRNLISQNTDELSGVLSPADEKANQTIEAEFAKARNKPSITLAELNELEGNENNSNSLNQSFYQGPQASQKTIDFTQLPPEPVLNRVTGNLNPRTPPSFTPPSFAINTSLVNPASVAVETTVPTDIASQDTAQSLLEQAKAKWIADTANSPAQQSGAFKPEQLWETHLNNQRWRKDQGRSFTHGEYL